MILYSRWANLTLQTRNKIASEFGIQKKGSVEVFSNTIKSDGYLVEDIEKALTLEALQKYLKTDEKDIAELWEQLIDKAEGRAEKSINVLNKDEAKLFKKQYNERKKLEAKLNKNETTQKTKSNKRATN